MSKPLVLPENSGENEPRTQLAPYLGNLIRAASAVPTATLRNSDFVEHPPSNEETLTVTSKDEVLPEPAILPIPGDDSDDSGLANSLHLNLHTNGLALQLHTRAPMATQLVELTTKLAVAEDRLNEMDIRLGAAIYRIGYLEAQLAEREGQIERLRTRQCDE